MLSLIYISTSQWLMSDADLAALLAKTRPNNESRDVTGMLLYVHGVFTQCLEGPEAAVRDLFARIKDDPRHRDVMVIIEREIAEREFAAWSMGFVLHPPDALSEEDGFFNIADAAGFQARLSENPDRAVALLRGFIERNLQRQI